MVDFYGTAYKAMVDFYGTQYKAMVDFYGTHAFGYFGRTTAAALSATIGNIAIV